MILIQVGFYLDERGVPLQQAADAHRAATNADLALSSGDDDLLAYLPPRRPIVPNRHHFGCLG